jgi:hypothetical protein
MKFEYFSTTSSFAAPVENLVKWKTLRFSAPVAGQVQKLEGLFAPLYQCKTLRVKRKNFNLNTFSNFCIIIISTGGNGK